MSQKYKAVLLFGPPGSGKGTQGKIIGAAPGFRHCACGDVFRALDKTSPMGILFAKYASSGSLVPDDFTIELWRQTMEQLAASGVFKPEKEILLLDGIPRTVEQAQLLEDKIDVLALIDLYVNDIEQIVSRLQHRAAKDKRADDTNEEVIRHRLDVYEEQTRPVLDFYPRGKIFRVNATQEMEQVTTDIHQALAFLNPSI